jgi:malonyl CoA-acyl carrier protein transacylase
LSDDEVAGLTVALADLPTRDTCAEWVHGDSGRDALALWTHLARRVPADYDATPLVLVAWSAWRQGDGALAGIAVERALAADPGHSLGLLVAHALEHGVNPKLLDEPNPQPTSDRGPRPRQRRRR